MNRFSQFVLASLLLLCASHGGIISRRTLHAPQVSHKHTQKPLHRKSERRLQDAPKKDGSPSKWVHDKEAVKKLEKYAITSLMTMVSLRIAQDIDSKQAKQSQATQARKLGVIGKFVKGRSLRQSLAKEKKDLRGYLQKHKIAVRKGLGLRQMESITKRYMKDRFNIRPAKFDVVKDLIGGIFRVTQKKARHSKL